jgi:putative transposase
VAKIVDDLDVLSAFLQLPAEHWIHLRTANPIESTFKLIESAQAHWRAVNALHVVALVRAGAKFENGKVVERPGESGGDQQAA